MSSRIMRSWVRALGGMFSPKVFMLSLTPIVLKIVLAVALGYFFWGPAVAAMQSFLDGFGWLQQAQQTLNGWVSGLGGKVAPALVILLSAPLLVMVSLLVVAAFITPVVARWVQVRRYGALTQRHTVRWWRLLAWMAGSVGTALGVFVLTLPLWLIPFVGLILPPLIWGWLNYRLMVVDVLEGYATEDEWRLLVTRHRRDLLLMGVLAGLLGGIPSSFTITSVVLIPLAPLILAVSMWAYGLIFIFTSLWFSHYLMDALVALREAQAPDADREPRLGVGIEAGAGAPGPGEALNL